MQSRGGEGGRQWQPAEWGCVKEGAVGHNEGGGGGALTGGRAGVSSRGGHRRGWLQVGVLLW